MKAHYVVGVRPNIVKLASLWAEAEKHPGVEPVVVHTGQHALDRHERLLKQLHIPSPGIVLAPDDGHPSCCDDDVFRMRERYEERLRRDPPDLVVAIGDVNSALAASLAASRCGVPLVHVEAGLRSRNQAMREEVNRVVIGCLAHHHFVNHPSGAQNLRRDGVPQDRIELAGNTALDTLHRFRDEIESGPPSLSPAAGTYAVVTVHRTANITDDGRLRGICDALLGLARALPVVVPLHEKTRHRLSSIGLLADLESTHEITVIPPLDYLEFMRLLVHSRIVLTDSGGIQDEAALLGVPCLTLRDETERPETLDAGANILVGADTTRILAEARRILSRRPRSAQLSTDLHSGAARRITESLVARFG